MRHILAVAVLGISLALGASAAVADVGDHERGDRHLPQTGPQMQVPDQPQQAAPADPNTSPFTRHMLEKDR